MFVVQVNLEDKKFSAELRELNSILFSIMRVLRVDQRLSLICGCKLEKRPLSNAIKEVVLRFKSLGSV